MSPNEKKTWNRCVFTPHYAYPVCLSYLSPLLQAQIPGLKSSSPSHWRLSPGILCVPASYQSQLSDIRGWPYSHICNHTHTLKHAHAQMHHPSPAGKLWIGFRCRQQPAAVQESTPAHAFSAAGSFLLQGNKVGGIAKDQYLFWCNRRVNRTVFILDSENCSFLPHLLAIYKRNLN